MAKIAVDIDDTLLDFNSLARLRLAELAETVSSRHAERLRIAAYTPWDEWRTPRDLAGEAAWLDVIDWCHSEEQILSRAPLPGAVEAMWDLSAGGHTLVYVSNRSPSTYHATETWLLDHAFPIAAETEELLCHTDDKLASIRDCQYLIDDRPKTLVGFVTSSWGTIDDITPDFRLPRRKAFALLMPYNRGLTDVPNIYLAPNWPLLGAYLREKIPSEVAR